MNRAMISGLLSVALAAAMPAAHAIVLSTTYQSDSNLSDYTSMVGTYATLSNFSAGDVGAPYTPTTATLDLGWRVYNGSAPVAGLDSGNNWILATFTSAQSSILVFPNIDHLGSAYDGFQYQIYGQNAAGGWDALFNATAVSSSGEPFSLTSYTGTAPTWVDSVVTSGSGSGPGGTVGYIAQFDFSSAYSVFAFGASTVAIDQGNTDQELSAVASTSVPEPATLGLLGLGLLGIAAGRRRRA